MGKRNSFVVSVFDVTFSRKNTGIREYFFFVIISNNGGALRYECRTIVIQMVILTYELF